MTYQQVRDIVARIRRCHQQLRDALDTPGNRAKDSRTQLILDSLRREEQELQLLLGRYGAQGEESLLNTWLQYVPDDDLAQIVASIEFGPELTAEEVVIRKLEFDNALIDLLETLSEETSAPRIREFFRSLVENAESRRSRQVWRIREYQGNGDPPSQLS